jgi:hypothetical protein
MMELAASPPKHFPLPALVLATASTMIAIPTQRQALIVQSAKLAKAIQQPGLRPSFGMKCQELAANNGELKANLTLFIEKSSRFGTIASELKRLIVLIDSAFNMLS